ncbi:hypothetical protein M758_12G131800 [Ceratodon purpureus]|nr:hypothetical protein M758_12G131800 [Ceratodon purpureus]
MSTLTLEQAKLTTDQHPRLPKQPKNKSTSSSSFRDTRNTKPITEFHQSQRKYTPVNDTLQTSIQLRTQLRMATTTNSNPGTTIPEVFKSKFKSQHTLSTQTHS